MGEGKFLFLNEHFDLCITIGISDLLQEDLLLYFHVMLYIYILFIFVVFS